jgi:hypothetical protein
MRQTLKDVLYGILIAVIVVIVIFIVEIFILFLNGEPVGDIKYPSLNIEMMITAFVLLFVTRSFAKRLKTNNMKEALRRGFIWISINTIFLLLSSLPRNEIEIIFGRIGTYVLLFCIFIGPMVYVKTKKLS